MKTASLFLFLSALAISSFGIPPPDIQSRLESFVGNAPGGIAVAWVDADGVEFFSAGNFAKDDDRPITLDTRFEIGSISKAFNGVLLAESVRAGKVSLNDPAAKHLLSADDSAQSALAKITLLSLATHQSGLPRLPANIGPNPDASPDPYKDYDNKALIKALRTHGPTAPVGLTFAYSNYGAAVLGEALASAWGTTYEEAVQAHVLQPLGMTKTSLSITGNSAPTHLAPGHAGGEIAHNWHFQSFAPAGALISSARELAIFLQASLRENNSPISRALAESLIPQAPVESMGGEVGLGWLLAKDGEHTTAWHNGGTGGYRSFLGFSRTAGKGIAVLTNRNRSVDALSFSLLGVPPPRPRNSPVKNAESFTGRYPLASNFAIDITTANGQLWAQATGQTRLALRQTTEDRFTIVGVPAEISFERDSAGVIAALVLHQNGANQRATRGSLPPPPDKIILPAEVLAEYVGQYPIASTFVLKVTSADGRLFIQATGQAKLEVFAKAKDEFFYKIVDAQVSFTRDESDIVNGLILHQNGRDMPAPKTD